ncbi:MAG: hypothetical protein K2P99_07765 [Burkholderiales bacterium]|nr:hypothetical protein [Burkholderiales bacterium]
MLFYNKFLFLVNRVLEENQGSIVLLKQYKGQSFYIDTAGFISFGALITDAGFLDKIVDKNTVAVRVTIYPTIATSLLDNNPTELIKHISFDGDKEFGIKLLEVFSNLQLTDSLFKTQSLSLTIIFDMLRKFITLLSGTLKLITHNASISIAEYLQYETMDVVCRAEVDNFCNSVDILREKTDLLIKRAELLGVE